MIGAMKPKLPVGTVTFLFSDIEGSTRLARELGTDRWREVLERHQWIWRKAFADHAGIEISTEGDSFFAVFVSAVDAVAAAVAAQRAIQATRWPAEAGPGVRVRVGVHTGEGRLGGDSYVGLDIHRAARIAAAANGGQTVVSASTRLLAASALPAGVSVADLGRFRLKDLDQAEELSRLVIAGIEDDLRPLRTLETPSNLPADLTSFVGRERQLADLGPQVRDSRLVTLTGPGGTGKTRLSLAVAASVQADFPDGVHFVELESITDPGLVSTSILTVLGIRQEAGSDAEALLAAHLHDRQVLLVLDNFEQVVAAAPLVGRLVAGAPRLHVLATSREALHLRGEVEVPVDPLGLPAPAAGELDLALLARTEAVALFVARAGAVAPGFALTADNAQAVAEICASLDGLPLAIELAAARVKVLAPSAILERLHRDLGILSSTERDRPERQRTLRGAIAWSYDLLEPPEQVLFRRAAIFVGGWTLEAAETICASSSERPAVLDGLASLVDKSLVRAEPGSTGEPRFQYLATIREYARDQLAETGESASLGRAHADYYTQLIESAAPNLAGREVVAWVARLDREHDNLRAAVRWSLETGEPATGLRILGTGWRFWYQAGYLVEGRDAIQELLGQPGAAAPTRARAIGLDGAGGFVYWLGDFDLAAVYWQEALVVFDGLGDRAGAAECHYNLAFIGMIRKDHQMLREHQSAALALYQELGDELGMLNAHESLVPALLGAGDLAGGEALLMQTSEAQRARGDWVRLGEDLSLLATFQALAGSFERARATIREALPIADGNGTLTSVVSALASAALIEARGGAPERAATIAGALETLTSASRVVIAQVAMLGLPSPADEARSRLEPETFARAYADGEGMTRAAIIDYALEGLGQ
jgi:predicted ATPase/class 3 adenylate cyclase